MKKTTIVLIAFFTFFCTNYISSQTIVTGSNMTVVNIPDDSNTGTSSTVNISGISVADQTITDVEIKAIFTLTSAWNNENGIRGVLLHSFGNFFQVLEGDKTTLLDLYENRIIKDDRHTDVYEVYNKPATKPVFTTYSSEFHVIKTSEQLDEIREYLDANKIASIIRSCSSIGGASNNVLLCSLVILASLF